MWAPIACIIAFVAGVGFTAEMSYSNVNPDQINKAITLCQPNNGLGTLRSNMWNERTVICVNGAVFEKFGEEQ